MLDIILGLLILKIYSFLKIFNYVKICIGYFGRQFNISDTNQYYRHNKRQLCILLLSFYNHPTVSLPDLLIELGVDPSVDLSMLRCSRRGAEPLPILHASADALLAGGGHTLDRELAQAASHHGDRSELAPGARVGTVGILSVQTFLRGAAHPTAVFRAHQRHLHPCCWPRRPSRFS